MEELKHALSSLFLFSRYIQCVLWEVIKMIDFNVKIFDENDDLDIYTNATKINIEDDKINVEYDNKTAVHQSESTKKIVIEPNR